ncbi:MAG: RNA polymerase sigma factor [Pirellulales bacterium]|nr:RNA polymerase sigma factor [Pirellulales bacterium]
MTPTNPRAAEDGPPDQPPIDPSAVLAQNERWLRTVVYARLGQPDAVDEVLQEVALAVVRNRAPLRDPTKVAPWLYRLAVTQALLHRRKLGRQRRLVDRVAMRRGVSEEDAREADPLDWLLARERSRLVREALARLPRREAEMLLLKYSEDWSYQQIADHLGLTHAAVESRLHRARAKLRQELTVREVIETTR